jgi:hypothetical protein
MKAMVKLAAAVGDKTSLSANCTISAALCSKTMNDSEWVHHLTECLCQT